jgi:D-arabinose 1-dehydrogenase-like Zn-dependent alcohol dehydrogenase
MKAKAAVFMGANVPFDVREFEVCDTPVGYGRCELIASGVCGTDLHFHRGKLAIAPPTIIGHEFVGRLTDCNKEEAEKFGLKVGDAVIADIAVPCGECLLCKSGDDANCVRMKVTNDGSIDVAPYLWGGYAEVNYTPLTNLVKIPEQLDPTAVATFACPGPTAHHAFRLGALAGIKVNADTVAVVQGLGPVGAYAVVYLKAMGVKKIYAIAARENKERERLIKQLGADEVLTLSTDGEEAITKKLSAENGGLGVDLCFEASGAPRAVALGINVLRNRGVYLIPGQYSASGGIEIQPQMITLKALHIIGSSQYSMCDVHKYLEFLSTNPDLHPEIEKLGSKYKVEQINEAIADAKSGNNIKTLLVK